MLKTENLILKTPGEEDYEALRRVRPSDEFYLMIGFDPLACVFVNDEKFDKSFSESVNKENYWHVFRGGEIIGIAFLHSIDGRDKRARYAVGIYNKKNWNKGYGREITRCILKYAFHNLGLHKVEIRVLEYNKRAIASYNKSGFVAEGILRENAFINNTWYDDIIMSILSHEFVYE